MAAELIPENMPIAPLRTLQKLREEIIEIAARNGIHNLRTTPDGRLYGAVEYERPYAGILDFERQVVDMLGVRVYFISDGALRNVGNDDAADLRPL